MNRHIANVQMSVRSPQRPNGRVWPILLMLWMVGAVIQMTTESSVAQEFEPSDRGLPGRREGGGTRGGCLAQESTLTALMPNSNKGSTLAEYPTFFWFVPETSATMAEFVLLDAANQEVYQTLLPVSQKSGVISLSLPVDESVPALEVGKTYRWYFSLVCDPLDRSADSFTSGWIERVAPSAALTQALATATPEAQPRIYANAGLWYEAVAALAKLRQEEPDNIALTNEWQTLLRSVGLEQVANQPLLPE